VFFYFEMVPVLAHRQTTLPSVRRERHSPSAQIPPIPMPFIAPPVARA